LKKYGTDELNLRIGQTLSVESLRGSIEMVTEAAMIMWGTGEPPARSSAVAEPTKQERTTTDIGKSYWADHGQLKHTVMRPFFEGIREFAPRISRVRVRH
jgi:hypothetical protein